MQSIAKDVFLDSPTPLKMLTIKQMLKRIPATLAQVKAGKTSENLLSEIREIDQKKLLKSMLQYNEFHKCVIQNG